MAQVEYIKHLYESEGKSLREIAKMTELNFRTVQKYAEKEDFNVPEKQCFDPTKFPVMGPYISIVDDWMEKDMREPRKQRHTAKRMFERLKEEHGFKGGYTSVKRYVACKRWMLLKENQNYLTIDQPQGHAQVDFGVFKYYDSVGKSQEGNYLVVTFPFSNAGWMQVYKAQNQECLLEGLKSIFGYVGGVPIRLRCDNMSTAVAQIHKGAERTLTDGFLRFKLHYRFETDFCNPDSGNEKGNVENKVGYDRRNMLVPIPTIEDFTVFNAQLLKRCDQDHDREHYRHHVPIRELWLEEKDKLLTLPKYEYDVFRYEAVTVNKTGYVTIDTNKYGLAPSYSGKIVQAKVFFDRVELYYDHALLITFSRSYGRNQEITDWKQYMPALLRKPGAVEHTRFFKQMPKLWQEHLRCARGIERKNALKLLNEIVEDGNAALCDNAMELACRHGKADNDSIRQCYYLIAKPQNQPPELLLATNPPKINNKPNLGDYDILTGRAMV